MLKTSLFFVVLCTLVCFVLSQWHQTPVSKKAALLHSRSDTSANHQTTSGNSGIIDSRQTISGHSGSTDTHITTSGHSEPYNSHQKNNDHSGTSDSQRTPSNQSGTTTDHRTSGTSAPLSPAASSTFPFNLFGLPFPQAAPPDPFSWLSTNLAAPTFNLPTIFPLPNIKPTELFSFTGIREGYTSALYFDPNGALRKLLINPYYPGWFQSLSAEQEATTAATGSHGRVIGRTNDQQDRVGDDVIVQDVLDLYGQNEGETRSSEFEQEKPQLILSPYLIYFGQHLQDNSMNRDGSAGNPELSMLSEPITLPLLFQPDDYMSAQPMANQPSFEISDVTYDEPIGNQFLFQPLTEPTSGYFDHAIREEDSSGSKQSSFEVLTSDDGDIGGEFVAVQEEEPGLSNISENGNHEEQSADSDQVVLHTPDTKGPIYMYKYNVTDKGEHISKAEEEMDEHGTVKGHYSLIQPDGRRRIVTYVASKDRGFQPVVRYEPQR